MNRKINYFEGDLWILDGTTWTNLTSKTKTVKDRDFYIKAMIKNQLIADGKFPDQRTINMEYNNIMMEAIYDNNVEMKSIPTNVILTNNALVNLDDGTIEELTESNIPFTPYQVGASINLEKGPEHADVTLAKKFLKEVTGGDKNKQQLILEIIGTSMSPKNESIFPVLYSPHKSSGKGTIMDIIGNINGMTREIKGEKWWNEGNNFSLSSIRNQLVGWIDEVPAVLPKASTEKIKSYADDKKYLEIERKGIDQERMLNTTTFIATTNHRTELYSVDDSIKGRMIWIDFEMNLTGSPKFTKNEIETIKNSPHALNWFATKGVEAYLEMLKRPGTRKERYTQVQSDVNYWNGIKEQSIALEIIESNEALSLLWDSKETFLSNDDLEAALNGWKLSNKDSKITKVGFQNEIIAYIHSNKLGVANRSKHKGIRGISVEWTELTEGEYVVNYWGDKVLKEEWDRIIEQQVEEAILIEEQEIA